MIVMFSLVNCLHLMKPLNFNLTVRWPWHWNNNTSFATKIKYTSPYVEPICYQFSHCLHRFPHKNKNILLKWVAAVGRHNWIPSKTAVLCGRHFLSSDFLHASYSTPGLKKKMLKKDAVPSIFSTVIIYQEIFLNCDWLISVHFIWNCTAKTWNCTAKNVKLHCKNVKLHCKYCFLIGWKAADFLIRKFPFWAKNKYGGRQEYERSKSANLEPSSLHESPNDAKNQKYSQ